MGQDSRILADEILQRGIKTLLTTIDTSQLDGDFCGRWYNRELIESLPEGVDPCGEDGEFHTLVVEAPCFDGKLDIALTEIEQQSRFHYQRYCLT